MEDHNITGACRMSAITKMIMESMRLKTMTSSLVEIKGTNPPESRQGSNYTRLFDSAEYASLVSCVLVEEEVKHVSERQEWWNIVMADEKEAEEAEASAKDEGNGKKYGVIDYIESRSETRSCMIEVLDSHICVLELCNDLSLIREGTKQMS
ncbi:hypothetical protein JHK86_032289 [Glycine max]|nr:hypothetical protein JHK86_032289 [Glycine max]